MTPTRKATSIFELGRYIPVNSKAEALKLFTLSVNERHYLVSWNGHQFEANAASLTFDGSQNRVHIEHDWDADDLTNCLLYKSPSPRDS